MEIYLVGGAVRDKLLGKTVHERDYVVVGASPADLTKLGYRQVGKDFPVFLHPTTNEEYALARTERKAGVGYTGFAIDAAPTVTLEQDLLRRDLTINAIAEREDGSLIDPYHGLRDLEARVLRHVSEAFVEDPLRVLRVARFAARFAEDGFTVAPETLALMRAISAGGELSTLAAERVWQETRKAFATAAPITYLRTLQQAHALQPWLLEFNDSALLDRLEQRLSGLCPTEPMLAYACCVGELDAIAGQALATRLRVPNEWEYMAELARHCHYQNLPTTHAKQWMQCIQRADGWRRPERIDYLLQIWRQQGQSQQQGEQFIAAYQAAKAVNARELIAAAKARGEQLHGPAVGDAVDVARLAAITAQLDEPHQ
ncbi:hypothetical protein [Pseudidiomarina sediminum]|uniref:hypothetical protein n=1 Tax=Pseudidiomarina sediminum TaxID=431675 RepID=UPI001C970592|nr:hypothetical protein [Pseudidiomarina sediminum]